MSWHTDQLKYALGLGGLVSFYGIVSLIVFVGGHQFGLNLTYRVVIIALILLTLPFALVIGYFATRKKKPVAKIEQPADVKVADEGAPQPAKISSPNGKYAELNQNADAAIQFLKTSNLSGTKGAEAVYSLPFFVFAGAPKSGKTSLVLSSGLNFQTLPNQRQSEQTQIRPTRDIDWRVASDAVILDTAGRYQTETEPDADEWSALLETLKKNRAIRPLDGFVLVANAEKLLAASEAEIEQQAKILRNRLDEALTRAKVRFPVYLIFTHSDAIEGFRDSFSASQQEGKNSILGATFPLEKAATAHTLFDAEFDALQQSLMKRRLVRLSAPFPPLRQLRIFNFPSHFNSSRRKLGHFVATLFRPNPFSESPLFRGFYFTASLPQALQQRGATENAPIVQSVGTTYFSERFFRDILLRDKDLVAIFQAQKRRPPILGWLMLVFGAGLLAILLGLSAVSLLANRNLLADSVERGKRVLEITQADKGRDPLSKDANAARTEVEAVNDLRETLAKVDKYERNGAPLWMRLGLYSGSRVFHERLLPIYFASVEQRYKKPVVKNIEDDLQKFAANQTALNSANLTDDQEKELGKNYDLLKAYLMLSGDYKSKAEPIFLASQLEDYWKKSSPPELENLSQQQLAFYTEQVDREGFPSIQLNKNLVDAVRKRLTAYPPVFRYYKRVTTEIDKKIDAVSVESVLAGQSAGVLEGTAKVPGSFTIEAYRGEMQKAILIAPTELSKDDWVMGEPTTNVLGTNDDVRKLQDRYFQEYTDAWRKFVRGVNVTKITSKEDAVNSLKAFSSTQSPMELLLKEVARNTNLSAKPKARDWWGWIMSYFQTATATKTDGNSEVEKEFKPLFAFVGEGGKPDAPTPISLYRDDLRRLVEPIEGASPDKIQQITKDLAADKDTIGLRKAESNISTKTEAFKTSAAQEVAELLKKPLQNLRVFFGIGVLELLEKMWKEQVLPKAQEIEKGYPFSSDAGEADLQKLTAYLNPTSGTLSKFYTDRLEKYFEESNGEFKVKDTAEVKFSPEFVAYLNNAFKLRQALFGTNATINFEYEFKLAPVKDSAVVEVSIDNQKTDSTSTGSAKFAFPGKSGGETGAFLQFTGNAESTAPPAANPAANLSANQNEANVNSAANQKKLPTNANPANTAPNTSLPFPGQWGLFKMVDAGSPSKNQAGEYVLTYTLGGKKIIATVRPTGGDLFDKTIFRQLRAPEKMLKQ